MSTSIENVDWRSLLDRLERIVDDRGKRLGRGSRLLRGSRLWRRRRIGQAHCVDLQPRPGDARRAGFDVGRPACSSERSACGTSAGLPD